MSYQATIEKGVRRYLSSDHDPLYRFYQWKANLRIRETQEIKTVPYAPLSHPFTERRVGIIRREYLDQIIFWNQRDLEEKLEEFRDYYNAHRVRQPLNLKTPEENAGKGPPTHAELSNFEWRSQFNGLIHSSMAT